MTLTSIFRGEHLEPPPWLYAWMARGSMFRLVYRRFVADLAARLPAGARVLDVGTGPGYLLGYLTRERPDLDLWGLDLASAMIRRARRREAAGNPRHVKWLVGDAQALPLTPGTFDLALATFSLHTWPRPATGLAEMLQVIKPGGQVWIYEIRREATRAEIQAFAREERLPFLLIYLGFALNRRYHTFPAGKFTRLFEGTAGNSWQLLPVHHIFWRAELGQPA